METSIKVRMYNQNNLGDCFLITCNDGQKLKYILIDFGSYEPGNDLREIEIAKNILKTVGNNPLTIVLTHQHKDHLSGFISAKEIFDQMNISEVWFSYLDNPTGDEAIAMRSATEKFWNKNKENKDLVAAKFKGNKKIEDMLEAKKSLDLFAEDQTGGKAITNLINWSKNNCHFHVPGKHFPLEGLPPNTINVYVLGPPTDPTFLKKLNPNKDESVNSLNSLMTLNNLESSAQILNNALHGSDVNFPFNKRYFSSLSNANNAFVKYKDNVNNWRTIDEEWLGELGGMSLHMDTLTNNSSLVLAFELVQSKKVVLFVGDAQIGNWKSWENVIFENSKITSKDLLSRTVFYKAGHHSSHNATLIDGLNLMNENELVIMIPVNQKVSDNRHFAMLKSGMLAGYNRKSKGKVFRSDTIIQPPVNKMTMKNVFINQNNPFFTKNIIVEKDGVGSHLYLEYEIK